MLITFEGIEGSGKTTQIGMLCDALAAMSVPFLSVREPGGTPLSESVRRVLLTTDLSIEREAELLLFEASRADLVRKVIAPALAAGTVIVCDRFTDSTVAYQGYGRGLPLTIIDELNRFVTAGVTISRTYLLDNSLETMTDRCRDKAKDRIESEDIEFHRRVQEGFRALARQHPERILSIDAGRPAGAIHEIIMHDLKKLL